MYPLELWLLKRFCDKYEIDYQEIDNTLTYWENKEHLKSIALGPIPTYGPIRADLGGLDDWENRLAAWESQMEWHLKNHFLEYYIACIEARWTISEEMGETPPHYPRFSLETYIQQIR